MSTLRSARRPRRHGTLLEPLDRRVLERAGWRTTLDYHENHLRARDGRLLEIEPTWTAEAERYDGEFAVALGRRCDGRGGMGTPAHDDRG